MRDFHYPGRSTVHGADGMAATSQPASTLAAVEILRRGGNAIDAAISAAAVQAVVEPHSTGIGGDCFTLLALNGSADVVALNGSGHAPKAATTDKYQDLGLSTIPLTSAHAVTVPGAIDAWTTILSDYGTMSLDEVFSSAITYAQDGYAVHPRSAHGWTKSVDKLKADPMARHTFLPNDKPPKPGQLIYQPELAGTLKTIAREGRDGFYCGEIAQNLVGYLNLLGGLHSVDDFASQKSEYIAPIKSSYQGHDIYQCPPNGQGIAVLIMLGILEQFDLPNYAPLSKERIHLESEATRLAYHVLEQTICDPRQGDIPVDYLLSSEHLNQLTRKISLDSRMTDVPDSAPIHPETIYLTVVDRDRNAISLINSVCFAFGSGLVEPKSGILLHNRGSAFSLDPLHPNAIAPHKRPRHTIIPGLVTKNSQVVMPFGVMGGQFQPVGQVRVLTNFLDYQMDLQEALDGGRSFSFGGILDLEPTIPKRVAAELSALGHNVRYTDTPLGSGQAIWIDYEQGTLVGASDPRKDGLALGY